VEVLIGKLLRNGLWVNKEVSKIQIQHKKPSWLKIKLEKKDNFSDVKDILKENNLVTVCEEAHCPNISECWNSGTATFMIMGNSCTRACKFCAVKTAFPGKPLDKEEPKKIANVLKKWNLDYVVITSVDRDDLKDQGSNHFSDCIREVRKENPSILIEVLIPDFKGQKELIKNVIDVKPNVIGHNIETVERLQKFVRDPRANYNQSLGILKYVKEVDDEIYTKSSIMLGLGETEEEVTKAMKDLREINVDFLTLGQYLRPSLKHIEVKEYVSPDKFNFYKKIGEELGFLYVASGPFVRSSYKAGEFFIKSLIQNG